MGIAIIAAAIYIILMPIFLRIICVIHKNLFIKRPQQKKRLKPSEIDALPKPLWGRIKEKVKFALKDERPFQVKGDEPKEEGIPNKTLIKLIWFAGLAITVFAGFSQMWILFAIGLPLFYASILFGVVTSRPILKAREKTLNKMYEIAKSTLRLSAEYDSNPAAAIQIMNWRDSVKPTKVKFEVPTSFDASGEEVFLRQFNQVFGNESSWVPSIDPDNKEFGWNYEEGELVLKEMPPLPQMAPWSAHYVLDEGTAWSFFPVAIGVENGVEIPHPETGKMENVLGFDFFGEQAGVSKKMGRFCGGEIVTSPMVLAAGGTGGGKSVVQRNIILGCVLRPDHWRFLGIDLKKVELSSWRAYSNVVLGIATELEDALTVLRFAQTTMMKRYAEMEQLGVNNFLNLPEKGQALMVMVDEAGELLSTSGVKALSEKTIIPTLNGPRLLKDLEIGDVILDNYTKPTVITQKYEPVEQDKYSLTVSRDNDNKTESFIAGSEHYWVAYFEHPDGSIIGPEIVETRYLSDFKKIQAGLPLDERVKVKFKKYG